MIDAPPIIADFAQRDRERERVRQTEREREREREIMRSELAKNSNEELLLAHI